MLKKISKYIFIVAILIISDSVYSAIVSDNDGSAFVTKAEFDSLKSNFNKQINDYNSSIDSKIDGAIASYLSGIKLAEIQTVGSLYSPEGGVLSLSSDSSGSSTSLLWKEGDMKFLLSTGVGRFWGGAGNQVPHGEVWLNWESEADNKFWETLIKDVDYNTGYGAFAGYKATKQNISINSFSTIVGSWALSNSYKDSCYLFLLYGFGKISNKTISQMNGTPYVWYASIFAETPTAYANTNYAYNYGNQSIMNREINNSYQEIDKTFEGGLILNRSALTYNRFSNVDEIRDWCNDSSLNGHTAITEMSHFGATPSVTVYFKGVGSDTYEFFQPTNTGFGKTTNVPSNSSYQKVYPYFGFVTNANNWNKIYVADMDSIYDSIFLSDDTNKLTNTLINKSRNHIKIGAGLPLASFKKNSEITYEFDFKDKTKDYNVWVKEGSFNSSKSLSEEYSSCISNFMIADSTTQYNSTYHCLKIKNGEGKVKFVTTKNCVPFLKWTDVNISSVNDMNCGGGVLYPMKNINYALEN